MPKIVAKSIQTCFECVLGQTFRKLFAQFSMECRVFENFQKYQKICKTPKTPKIVPKSIQTCFELVLSQIFRKIFCPVFRGGSSFRKFSKKNIFKIPKMPKSVPKRLQTCFRVIFSKKSYAQCSMEDRDFEKLQKKSEKFQNSKNAQNCCQKYPNVF